MRVGPKRRWGTWEELILGGAVIRHGTLDWNVVAAEVRTRSIKPYGFTPAVCKAKYEELQRRYSGCTGWFEELRKRRVAELKRELDKSEDSIGLLVSKLEILKAKKGTRSKFVYYSNQVESPLILPKTKDTAVVSSGKDGLSAGSYTLDSCTPETDAKPLSLEFGPKNDIVLRKRRGKRKRKEIKEECNNLGSTKSKQISTSESGQIVSQDLMAILNSVSENKHALCFKRRLDSQKRARYKEIIRQHMDLETIRSRIVNRTIRSSEELFRDMLLVANNALVFYSRRTREYKSALTFRDLVSKSYHEHRHHNKTSPHLSPIMTNNSPVRVRPRSARPRSCKTNSLTKIPESIDSGSLFKSFVMGKKNVECELDRELAVPKYGFGLTGKTVTDRSKTPVTKERKKIRQKS